MAKPAVPIMATALVRCGQTETGIFTAALIELERQDLRTPCSDTEISHWWLSDDARERSKAANLCRPCRCLLNVIRLLPHAVNGGTFTAESIECPNGAVHQRLAATATMACAGP
jgi:hypothetical protein